MGKGNTRLPPTTAGRPQPFQNSFPGNQGAPISTLLNSLSQTSQSMPQPVVNRSAGFANQQQPSSSIQGFPGAVMRAVQLSQQPSARQSTVSSQPVLPPGANRNALLAQVLNRPRRGRR